MHWLDEFSFGRILTIANFLLFPNLRKWFGGNIFGSENKIIVQTNNLEELDEFFFKSYILLTLIIFLYLHFFFKHLIHVRQIILRALSTRTVCLNYLPLCLICWKSKYLFVRHFGENTQICRTLEYVISHCGFSYVCTIDVLNLADEMFIETLITHLRFISALSDAYFQPTIFLVVKLCQQLVG